MGRWRAPDPKSSAYITAAGHERLSAELTSLWEKRAEVTKALAAAAAEGDRSENAEYIYRKKQLREIDRRIGYLQKRIPQLNVVTEVENTDKIYFGAWVLLEDDAGEEYKYRIVGPDEIDVETNYISIDSPMARALLGKRVDDEISLAIQEQQQNYYILQIDYE